jgi:hypothetical protein
MLCIKTFFKGIQGTGSNVAENYANRRKHKNAQTLLVFATITAAMQVNGLEQG